MLHIRSFLLVAFVIIFSDTIAQNVSHSKKFNRVGVHIGLLVVDKTLSNSQLFHNVVLDDYSFSAGFFVKRKKGKSLFQLRTGGYFQFKGDSGDKSFQFLVPFEYELKFLCLNNFKFHGFVGGGLEFNFWNSDGVSDVYRFGYNMRAGLDLEYNLSGLNFLHLEVIGTSSPRAYYVIFGQRKNGGIYGFEFLLKFSKSIKSL